MNKLSLILALSALAGAAAAQTVVYDNTTNRPTQLYLLNTGGVFGQAITLAAPGTLSSLSFSVVNPNGGLTMLTGTETVRFYDNTTPYVSGALALPLLGSVTYSIAPNLTIGDFKTYDNMPVTSGFALPANVFFTTQYTPLTGTATQNGVALTNVNSTVGINSYAGLYISGTQGSSSFQYGGTYFAGSNYNEYFKVTTQAVPEPATLAALGLGAVAMLRRRKKN